MKKKNLKSLKMNKTVISNFQKEALLGGNIKTTVDPASNSHPLIICVCPLRG
ncbi:hypothetical protein [uncultured Kordia sp.]|uniref:hypothetical protein n=1 Tax=uncultured Kordia sp. TaxID=507699 RepID=UPI002638CDBA|nr:hypothetical protein [uncultured Kordia sp.]